MRLDNPLPALNRNDFCNYNPHPCFGAALPVAGCQRCDVLLKMSSKYPPVIDPDKVGDYPTVAGAGGGYVWDEVLEYRVWCHPERGAPDKFDGEDYYYPFPTYEAALEFATANLGTEDPLALILQREHINEIESGVYVHVTEERSAEWPVEFLNRPRRTPTTIPDFLSPDAPSNRLAIIRGLAPNPRNQEAE